MEQLCPLGAHHVQNTETHHSSTRNQNQQLVRSWNFFQQGGLMGRYQGEVYYQIKAMLMELQPKIPQVFLIVTLILKRRSEQW